MNLESIETLNGRRRRCRLWTTAYDSTPGRLFFAWQVEKRGGGVDIRLAQSRLSEPIQLGELRDTLNRRQTGLLRSGNKAPGEQFVACLAKARAQAQLDRVPVDRGRCVLPA